MAWQLLLRAGKKKAAGAIKSVSIAKKGFGLLGKTQAKQRMLRGTSTRADRIKHGGRSADIKKGEKAKKGLKQMRDTKRAFKIGKEKTFPSEPGVKE